MRVELIKPREGADMRGMIFRSAGVLALVITAMFGAQTAVDSKTDKSSARHQTHHHGDDSKDAIYKGFFENNQIKPRVLSDWAGDWQSVYPYLQTGMLDAVMIQKAEKGDKSAEEYRAYYETGYRTDVHRIVIKADRVTFHKSETHVTGRYASDGYEILTYAKGNRGVRFIFRKISGDAEAPQYIQFSDHRIAPAKADHYHLYWGNDRAALLKEVINWPTYYPSSLSGERIADEMMAH